MPVIFSCLSFSVTYRASSLHSHHSLAAGAELAAGLVNLGTYGQTDSSPGPIHTMAHARRSKQGTAGGKGAGTKSKTRPGRTLA